ncbi:DUF3800 domain-containing protein [Candidatus Microgenomates bacterium]|nr:DUF3800 domain-containing protein [Candidatus Microgenomates bacterium]
MHIMYIDESGDTISLPQGGKKFLVLTGCIVEDMDKIQIEERFRSIKQKYYQNPDIEIKSNFLRYANPNLLEKSPIKLKDREKYDELEKDITNLLKDIPVVLYSVVIHKTGYWKLYPSQNPYEVAYIFLAERFQMFLKENESLGICIIDPREGQVEKSFIGEELDHIHSLLRWEDHGFWQKCPNIIERLLFATSEKTVGIQLADLYCYPVYHIFEYNKGKEEYWRFHEVTLPKLYKSSSGRLLGYGLKFFPDESKKGLHFFR